MPLGINGYGLIRPGAHSRVGMGVGLEPVELRLVGCGHLAWGRLRCGLLECCQLDIKCGLSNLDDARIGFRMKRLFLTGHRVFVEHPFLFERHNLLHNYMLICIF